MNFKKGSIVRVLSDDICLEIEEVVKSITNELIGYRLNGFHRGNGIYEERDLILVCKAEDRQDKE